MKLTLCRLLWSQEKFHLRWVEIDITYDRHHKYRGTLEPQLGNDREKRRAAATNKLITYHGDNKTLTYKTRDIGTAQSNRRIKSMIDATIGLNRPTPRFTASNDFLLS